MFVQDQPFLIIECKRDVEKSGVYYSIGQAYTYALLAERKGYRVNFVAIADPLHMAFFEVPNDLEEHANWEAVEDREYDRAFYPEFFERAIFELYVTGIKYYLLPSVERLYNVLKRLREGKTRADLEDDRVWWRLRREMLDEMLDKLPSLGRKKKSRKQRSAIFGSTRFL